MRIYALIFYSMLIFKFQKVFLPPVIFRNAEREGITVLKCRIRISFGVILIKALVVTRYYLLLYLSIYWPYFDNMLTNGQTDWHRQSRVLLDMYWQSVRTAWTPNAYHNMLMRIFTPSLYFQCVFNDFQCVITLLRALSVALGSGPLTFIRCVSMKIWWLGEGFYDWFPPNYHFFVLHMK